MEIALYSSKKMEILLKESLSIGVNFFKGALVWASIQTIETQGDNLNKWCRAFFKAQNEFRINKELLKLNWEKQLACLRAEGISIPPGISPEAILWARCPKKECLRQIEAVLQQKYTAEDYKRETFLLTIIFSLAEELFFRGVIQDIVLKRLVIKIAAKKCPQYIQALNSKVYTVMRILLTSVLFSYAHRENPLAEKYVSQQVVSALINGIAYGVLKETFGLAASVGAHMMNNFTASLPELYSEC